MIFFGTGAETDFTPEYWESIKASIDESVPGAADLFSPIYAEMFTHNAEVYSQIIAKTKNKEGVLCLVDASASQTVLLQIMNIVMGTEAESEAVSISEIAYVESVESTPPLANIGGNYIKITPIKKFRTESDFFNVLGKWGSLILKSDGSLLMMPDSNVDNVVLYVPRDGTLPDDFKAANAALYNDSTLFNAINSVVLVGSAGEIYIATGIVLAHDTSNNALVYTTMETDTEASPWKENVKLTFAVLSSDGAVKLKSSVNLASFDY